MLSNQFQNHLRTLWTSTTSTGYCLKHKEKTKGKFQLSLESTMPATRLICTNLTRLICTNLNRTNNQERNQCYWTSLTSETTFRVQCLHTPNIPTCSALWARAAQFVFQRVQHKGYKVWASQSHTCEILLRNWENPACFEVQSAQRKWSGNRNYCSAGAQHLCSWCDLIISIMMSSGVSDSTRILKRKGSWRILGWENMPHS